MKKESGLSLIESALVIMIAVSVISGVVFYWTGAKTSEELEYTQHMITHVQQKVLALYANQDEPDDDLSISTLKLSNIKTKKNDKNTILLPGNIELRLQRTWDKNDLTLSDESRHRFYVILSNLNADQCAVLGGGRYGKSGTFGGAYIYRDGTYKNIADLDMASRIAYCSQKFDGHLGNIGLIFSIKGNM
ncbi:hypothetical protein JZL99_22845 [Escherichia coli]|uniref:hypothetical protein n=1 Tax=Escherichia coli TaxID=562 RepID=UPI0019D30AF8|nr:hypothetical protein [Escherichia coli]MBN6416933.1 hypothetical protein [Escherichia coli]